MNVEPKRGTGQLARAGETDYHTVLMRVIQSTTKDPAQLRNLVYELARIKLRREIWLQDLPLEPDEAKEHLRALESAIADIEAITSLDEERAALPDYSASSTTGPAPRPVYSAELAPISINRRPDGEITIIDPPERARQYERIALVSDVKTQGRTQRMTARFLQLAGVAVMGGIIYAAISGHADSINPFLPSGMVVKGKEDRLAQQIAAQAVPAQPAPPPPSPYPIPTTYGVYALNQGRLHQLEPLPQRVPDERVLMGPVLTNPSGTVLVDGKVAFILFRRDLGNAPDRIPIRVVAQVVRAMSIENGKAVTRRVEGSWALRGKSADFRVAPMPENPQMLMIKPDNEGFELTPGRYALILKNEAFDFTVPGKPTDVEHCLERFEAPNGGVYNPCKTM